jgi:hypothetical protein
MSETSKSNHPSPVEEIEMPTAGNPQPLMEQSRTMETSCSIEELQSAFGSILAADKHVDPIPDYKNISWKDCWNPWYIPAKPAKRNPESYRTGTFPFFSFPRELRDRIYFHYLYRPKGVVYRRKTANDFLYDKPSDKPSELMTSLFLTCHQVYEEALPIFCRHNEVEIESRYQLQYGDRHGKAIAGTLRLFPDKYARLLQRVNITFGQYTYIYVVRTDRVTGEETSLPPGEAFIQMLRDAYAFKDTFPKLREFNVCFRHWQDFFGASSIFEIEGHTDEEKIGKIIRMMKWWLGNDKIVLPKWFRFKFEDSWSCEFLRPQEGLFNEAYARLLKESAERDLAIEESGKMWLEEVSAKERDRRGKRRSAMETEM